MSRYTGTQYVQCWYVFSDTYMWTPELSVLSRLLRLAGKIIFLKKTKHKKQNPKHLLVLI